MKVLILSVLSLLQFYSFAGTYHKKGEVDGGGADHPEYLAGTAWFLKGHKPHIDICLKIESDTNLEQERTQNEIRKVYRQWNEYIEQKVYDEETDEEFRYVMDIKFSCAKPDLEIFIGEWNEPRLNKIKAKFNYPLGLAYREEKYEEKGWSKGLIWIAKDFKTPTTNHGNVWDKAHNLYMILLHEIGHTFGNPHKPNTIMKGDIVNDVIYWDPFGNDQDDRYYHEVLEAQRNIDREDTLVFCDVCLAKGEEGQMYLPGSIHEDLVFNKLLNRSPVGKVSTSYELLLQTGENEEELKPIEAKYIVKDDLGVNIFRMQLYPHDTSVMASPYDMFKRFRIGEDYISINIGTIEFSNMFGVLHANGEKFTVMMDYNKFGLYFEPPVGEPKSEFFVERVSALNFYIIENGRKLHLFTKNKVWDNSQKKELSEIKTCSLPNYFSI